MTNLRDRLMVWHPDADGYNHDEIILAVGLQCESKEFLISDVVAWLGPPDRAEGNSANGHLAYLYAKDHVAGMFDVADGRIVNFGAIARCDDNSKRVDPVSGEEVSFNCLDEMKPFDAEQFLSG